MANVVITGAGRGIGLELTRKLVGRGDNVVAVCRTSTPELEDIADQIISGVDVTDHEAVEQLATPVYEFLGSVDLLINNAGVFENERLGKIEYDQIRYQFEVNSIAPLHMAEVLLPMMKEGSKIANITSRMGSMADNGSGGYYGYRASKAALNAFGKSMAMDLKSKGVAVALLHPGFVQTRMVNFSGDITAEQSAAGLLERIDHLSIENSGGFWHSNGQELPW